MQYTDRGSRYFPTGVAADLLRYFFVGGAAALSEWAIFAALIYLTPTHYIVAAAIAFIAATAVNYQLSLRFVFVGGRHRRHREILYVYLASAVGAGINLGILTALVELFSVHVMLAKVIGTGCAFLWNFLARYLWIFHPRPH